ncbi:Nif3-like dinuclear metal center hexameric protein [Planctobacterium marinum]|uniref:Nif3-like dinuclear metal center hexameric protein n=1 Tax=Planctobacterium marinum TaxID=1631968 RepID=UPI001E3C97B2|nr:Nif3-like dinuclear metal center hexameric protein [Planctobacterium marinum]MCC2604397.1 Nif3-like dinuclear metal center hexameric protein [Planctobacterium marinum]
MKNTELLSWLNQRLQPQLIKDYCPNGLQVEGKSKIQNIITGVTACQALIDAAIEHGADALLVHHGFFWKSENPAIVGMKYQRIKALIDNGINLYAYHLPLDVHPEFGNNSQLGKLLGLTDIHSVEAIKPEGVVMRGTSNIHTSVADFAKNVEQRLGRTPMVVGNLKRKINQVAWCTGGGQSFIEQAAEHGIDMFISGEISEQTTHIARELGIAYLSAGHHATERYGIKALGEVVARELALDVSFIDIDNPV